MSPHKSYGFLALAIALNMAGHLMFKFGATASAEPLRPYVGPFTVLGLGAYSLSAIGYIAALRTMALSIAMPSLVVGYLETALLAYWIGGDAFGPGSSPHLPLIALELFLFHW